MTAKDVIAELQKVPPETPVYVAESLTHNQALVDAVIALTERGDDSYVLLVGPDDD